MTVGQELTAVAAVFILRPAGMAHKLGPEKVFCPARNTCPKGQLTDLDTDPMMNP